MAVSINWGSKVIFVPQADLTLISPGVYEHNIDTFWSDLHALQAGENGLPADVVFSNNSSVTFSGTTLPRVLQIINGYTVEYEDGQYQVNLEGANSNILDVRVQNQVSLNAKNSAGLIIAGDNITEATIQSYLALVEKRIIEAMVN